MTLIQMILNSITVVDSAAIGGVPLPMQAPTVALQGLYTAEETRAQFLQETKFLERPPISMFPGVERIKTLVCLIKEPRPFLLRFRLFISKIFRDHGFEPTFKSAYPAPYVPLMTTRYLTTNVPKKTNAEKHGYLSPTFDASDFRAEYRNFSWTTQFPLERVCISERNLRDVTKNGEVVRTVYKDIASVNFSGSTSSEASTQLADHHQYKKAAKTQIKNLPKMPVHIPSTPPLVNSY